MNKLSAIEAEIARIEQLYRPRRQVLFELGLTPGPGEGESLRRYCDDLNRDAAARGSAARLFVAEDDAGRPWTDEERAQAALANAPDPPRPD